MNAGDTTGFADFVQKVFAEFVAPLYQDEGVDEFSKYVTAKALADRLTAGNIFVVAENGSKTIGVIEMRENHHIALLFVEASSQRQGVARELIRQAVALCRERAHDLQTVTVNSSPNAFAAYRRLGFRPTGEERTVNGIRFIPMALPLEENN